MDSHPLTVINTVIDSPVNNSAVSNCTPTFAHFRSTFLPRGLRDCKLHLLPAIES